VQESKGLMNPKFSGSIYSEKNQETILKMYLSYIDTTTHVTNWRNGVSRFFITLNTIVFTVVATLNEFGLTISPRWLIFLPVSILVLLCIVWVRMLVSYKQLNSAKFGVIREIEDLLPIRPLTYCEWDEKLKGGKDRKFYLETTTLEVFIPIFFALVYTTIGIAYFIRV